MERMGKNGIRLMFAVILVIVAVGCAGGGVSPIVQRYGVEGFVVDEGDSGMEGLTVQAVHSGGIEETTTEEDGSFVITGLRGVAEVQGPEIGGFQAVPAVFTVDGTRSDLEFKIYPVLDHGTEAFPANTPVLVYQGLFLDFSEAESAVDAGVTVTESEAVPGQGMTAAGPIVDIDMPDGFTGSVRLQMAASDSNSTLFRRDNDDGHWYPVLGAEYEGGMIHTDLSSFSTYGVFAAPGAAMPQSSPSPGQYPIGTEITLTAFSGGVIYFTTDGSIPTAGSTVFDEFDPLILGEEPLQVKAITVRPNHKSSAIASLEFVPEGNPEPDEGEVEPATWKSFSANGVAFRLRYVPGGGVPDSTSLWTPHARPLYLAETVVTYDLWSEVRNWALQEGYTFLNLGRQGGDYPRDVWGNLRPEDPIGNGRHPVTTVSWLDAVVWCNALSEMLSLEPVYRWSDGSVLRTASLSREDIRDMRRLQTDGFRLPQSVQWEAAARYRDDDDPRADSIVAGGRKWTPEDYASGATDSVDNVEATARVAWSGDGSMQFDGTTEQVALLNPNELGLYDMSGLVWEWTESYDDSSAWRDERSYYVRGGSWQSYPSETQTGFGSFSKGSAASSSDLGFRIAQGIF